jgi:hypothetical protein
VADPGPYVREELDVVPGLLTVLLGREHTTHVDIAAMMTKYKDPSPGSVLIGLFGSIWAATPSPQPLKTTETALSVRLDNRVSWSQVG